jgi:hypothetical protein
MCHGTNLVFLDVLSSVAIGLRPTPSVAAISETSVLKAELHEHVMQQCLLGDSTARPTFAELRTRLTA